MADITPSIEEVAGITQALQVISMAALGLFLANAKRDTDGSAAVALIEEVRFAIKALADRNSSALISEAAIGHGNHMLDEIVRQLSSLHRENARLN